MIFALGIAYNLLVAPRLLPTRPSVTSLTDKYRLDSYLTEHLVHHPELVERYGAFQVKLANDKDFIATRVAHKLDLTGPAVSLYTACSTSLVETLRSRSRSTPSIFAGPSSPPHPPPPRW